MDYIELPGLVIGGGVVGLSCAYHLAPLGVWLVEAEAKFGQGGSSRNSEVIHSGIYYAEGSLKKRLCLAGRDELYRFCDAQKIPYRRTGKLVVGWTNEDAQVLENLGKLAEERQFSHRWLDSKALGEIEPGIRARFALELNDTGIVDSHALMTVLERETGRRGGSLVYRHRITQARREGTKWEITLAGPQGDVSVRTPFVVNAAGLASAEVRRLAFPDSRYEHHYCRGRYFFLSPKYRGRITRLIYPPPVKDGLGTHLTLDMAGNVRLGPDVDWLPGGAAARIDTALDCDWSGIAGTFFEAAKRYFSEIQPADLSPGYIGIRPKLFLDRKAVGDFALLSQEGWVDCLGIESPGLTCSIAIGAEVAALF